MRKEDYMNYKEKNPKINIKNLGNYGFDDELVQGLLKHDLLPPIDIRTRSNGKKDYLMSKNDVLFLINRMLKNELKVYDLVQEADEKCKAAKELIENAPTVEAE